jgi:hypothetical protein
MSDKLQFVADRQRGQVRKASDKLEFWRTFCWEPLKP